MLIKGKSYAHLQHGIKGQVGERRGIRLQRSLPVSQQNIPNPLLGLSTTPPTLPQFLIKQVLKGPGPQYQTSQSGRPWREKGIQYPVNLL